MKTGWLQARQTRYTGYVTLYILIVLGALGLANWLANRHNKSVDTTANKKFSLSDQTIKVVKDPQLRGNHRGCRSTSRGGEVANRRRSHRRDHSHLEGRGAHGMCSRRQRRA